LTDDPETANAAAATLDAPLNPAVARGGLSDPVNRPLYSDRLIDALQVAARLHAHLTRKGTGIPDLSHLLGTCSIAMEFGADEDQAIAALLHDAIEDVEPVQMARAEVGRFGDEVLRIVEACTDSDAHPKPPWHDRKEAYLAHIPEADAAILLVSASDKLHNARTIVTDLHRIGPVVWNRFRASQTDSLWYYRALVDEFRANPAHQPDLIAELDRTVSEMRRLAK
jgi:(p)ppGpp synthase/HD superfamily hydrolase